MHLKLQAPNSLFGLCCKWGRCDRCAMMELNVWILYINVWMSFQRWRSYDYSATLSCRICPLQNCCTDRDETQFHYTNGLIKKESRFTKSANLLGYRGQLPRGVKFRAGVEHTGCIICSPFSKRSEHPIATLKKLKAISWALNWWHCSSNKWLGERSRARLLSDVTVPLSVTTFKPLLLAPGSTTALRIGLSGSSDAPQRAATCRLHFTYTDISFHIKNTTSYQ